MVTLVVPAYDEGVVIQSALKSLLELDYPNYEIIVVDDGSTDDTYVKAMEVARLSYDVPVRVVTKPNAGKAQALNTGMSLARGELVLNMDGDAKLSPTRCACASAISAIRAWARWPATSRSSTATTSGRASRRWNTSKAWRWRAGRRASPAR
jgi:Glycosyltransferases involved in cell wall biogenesis